MLVGGFRILRSRVLAKLGNHKFWGLILIVATFNLLAPTNAAVITNGQSCSINKVNQIIKSGKSFLICKKTGTKYLWSVSTSKAYKIYRNKLAQEELNRLNAEAEAKQKAQEEKDTESAKAAQDLEDAQAARQYVESQAERDSVSKGAAYRCIVGKFCSIGNIGPGGGVVFLGSGVAGNGKHYEIAPANWLTNAGDPQLMYCIAKDGIKTLDGFVFNGSNEPILQFPGKPGYVYVNNRIGDGKNNTKIIIERCKESAASKAYGYQGGGFSDWFLPSAAELMAAYVVREKIFDVQPVPYWSSSEFYSGGKGKVLVFDNAGENQDLPIGATAYVRPIRNF